MSLEGSEGNQYQTDRGGRAGKRPGLREVFSLGLYSVDLYKVDLSKLIRGQPLTLLYTISKNRLGIKTPVLIDTRVNSLTFIN